MPEKDSGTRWLVVWVLIFAGVIGALQIGKAPIAIPLLRDDLDISLAYASWIVGIYAIVGAVAGLPAGLMVNVLGARRCVVIGLLVIGAASCAGAFAASAGVLLLTRVLEGGGFIMVAIAAPTLLGSVAVGKDRALAFGLWTTYYATGSVIVTLAAPFLEAFGWRSLWLVTGFLALAYTPVIWSVVPRTANASPAAGQRLADVSYVLRAPGPLLLALAFGSYTFQYHALTGLLPTLLVERFELSLAAAGVICAFAIVANGLGAASAGFLLRRGAALWALLALAFTFMAMAAIGIFQEFMSVAGATALAVAALGVTGLVPASVYAASPQFSPQPALLPLTVGMVVQASHLGHLLGPSALGSLVEAFGWSSAPALFAAITCTGIAAALGIRRLSRRRAAGAYAGAKNTVL